MLSIKINCDIIHQDWKTLKNLKYYVYKIFKKKHTCKTLKILKCKT